MLFHLPSVPSNPLHPPDSESARSKVGTLKKKLKDLGEVNLAAPSEYEKVSTR